MRRQSIADTVLRAPALLLLLLIAADPESAAAQDHSTIYTAAELRADAERLAAPIHKLEAIIRDVLSPEERAAIDGLVIEFPMPAAGDFVLDYYAYSDFGEAVVVMPVMSLKMLEDVTTAYAFLLTQGYSPGTIDLYFTMLQEEDPSRFPGGRYPALLPALGVPADAWKIPAVDDLSLRLRNEAFAFVFLHELGHIILKHQEADDISVAQSRSDEIAADRFALEVLARTGTPALGASLLFQAQAFSLPHRGRFESDQAWIDFQRERGTHPITSERLRAFADYVSTELADRRAGEREIWRFIGGGLHDMVDLLTDPEMQRCMTVAAEKATLADLAPRRDVARALFRAACL